MDWLNEMIRHTAWLWIVTLAPAALGCAQGEIRADSEQRVVLQLRQGIVPDAPAWLARLREASRAGVEFVAPVSPTLAAYRLRCRAADRDCAHAVEAMHALPEVVSVEIDRRRGGTP